MAVTSETKWFCTECDRDTMVTSSPDDTRCVACGTGRVIAARRPSISEGVEAEAVAWRVADQRGGYTYFEQLPDDNKDGFWTGFEPLYSADSLAALSAELAEVKADRKAKDDAYYSVVEQNANLEEALAAAEAENGRLRKALEPFGKAASEFPVAIGPDGIDDGLTVLAYIHGVRGYEAKLSTSHFSNARAALGDPS